MTDWFTRYTKFNLTARITMLACVVMSWRGAEWFMNLPPEDQNMGASTFVSVILGSMTGVIGLYLGHEAKTTKEEKTQS